MVPTDPDQPPFLHRHRETIRNKIDEVLGKVWAGRVVTFVQFWELVIKGFMTNRCPVRATALAYTTLLALIPMLAVVASVTSTVLKSQGRERIDSAVQLLVDQIVPKEKGVVGTTTNTVPATSTTEGATGSTNTPSGTLPAGIKISEDAKKIAARELEDNREEIVAYLNSVLQKIQSGSLGVTGMIGLIVVAVLMFSTVETTFNDIWGVRQGRSWVARIVQYWTTVTLGPLIPFAVLSLNVGSQLNVDEIVERLWFSRFITEDLLPILILSFGFSFFYQLMPNTRVRWIAAFTGGLTAGTVWHLNSYMTFYFVSQAAKYANIYGSLAVIPLFLVGLYVSWLILLFGAQVTYAFQNRVAYLQEKEAQQINFLGRQYMALRIMTLIGERFRDPGCTPPSISEIAQHLRVSTRLVEEILKAVSAGGLVVETAGGEVGYNPTRPLEDITCHDVLMAMRTYKGNVAATSNDFAKQVVDDLFHRLLEAEQSVSATTTLADLVDKLHQDTPAAIDEVPTTAATQPA